jgi:hypothetical protein
MDDDKKPVDLDALDQLQAAELRALRGRAYKLYKGLRDVVCAVGGVANDGVSDEFLLNAAGEVRALRQELDTLRAEAARLREALEEAIWRLERDPEDADYVDTCPHCGDGAIDNINTDGWPFDEHGDMLCRLCGGHRALCGYSSGGTNEIPVILKAALASTPTTAEWLAERDAERETLRAEAARLREALDVARVKFDWIRQNVIRPDIGREFATPWHAAGTAHEEVVFALSSTPSTAEWLAARDEQMKQIGAAEELEKVRTGWLTSNEYRPGIPEIWRYIADRAARLRAGKGE